MLSCPSYVATPAIRFPVERRETLSLQSGALGNDVVICVAPHQATLGFSMCRDTNSSGVTQNWYVAALSGGSSTAKTFVDPYLSSLFNTVNGVSKYRWVSLCVEIIDTTAVSSASGEAFCVRPPWSRIDGSPSPGQHTVASIDGGHAEDWYNNLLACPGLQPMTAATLMGGVCAHATMCSRRAIEFEDVQDMSGVDVYSTTNANSFDYGWRGRYTDVNYATFPPTGNSPLISGVVEPHWRPVYFILGREANASARRFTLVFKGTVEVIPAETSFLTRLARPLKPALDGDEERWWAAQTRMSYMQAVRPSRAPPEARTASGVLGSKPVAPKPVRRQSVVRAAPVRPAPPPRKPVGPAKAKAKARPKARPQPRKQRK